MTWALDSLNSHNEKCKGNCPVTIFLIFLATFPLLSLQGRGRATEDKISSYGKSIKVRFATMRGVPYEKNTYFIWFILIITVSFYSPSPLFEFRFKFRKHTNRKNWANKNLLIQIKNFVASIWVLTDATRTKLILEKSSGEMWKCAQVWLNFFVKSA